MKKVGGLRQFFEESKNLSELELLAVPLLD
jgi:hypothetical protein